MSRYKDIQIATINGGHRRVAVLWRIGAFAVHASDCNCLAVTHVPTGRYVIGSRVSEAECRAKARELHVAKGANWNFSDAARMSKRTAAIGRRICGFAE